jgi:chaperone modulatory protein CbpM
MSERKPPVVTGLVLDEAITFGLEEMSRACGAEPQALIELVQEGVLEVQGADPQGWRFPAVHLRRARLACRLRHELELDLAGVAVALDLVEELHRLRARVHLLEEQLLGDQR